MPTRVLYPLLITASLVVASPAAAAVVASADEVCLASADPCIVDQVVETSSELPLDFGTRTVRVQGGGRFRGSLDLRAGRFESNVDASWAEVPEEGERRDVSVLARRGCSLDPSYACLDDDDCADVDLGTCSAGDGGLYVFGGDVTGSGALVSLHAVGGVQLFGDISVSGSSAWPQGGSIDVRSRASSVRLQGRLLTRSAAVGYFEDYRDIEVRAAGDIVLSGRIGARGGSRRVLLEAGGDVRVAAAIQLRGADYPGGSIEFVAGGDIDLVARRAGRNVTIDVSGGTDGANGHSAGRIEMAAGGSIRVAPETLLRGDGGVSRGLRDDNSVAADVDLQAHEDLNFEGRLVVRGRGAIGYTDPVRLHAGKTLRLTSTSRIYASAYSVSDIDLDSGDEVQLDGIIEIYAASEGSYADDYGSARGMDIVTRDLRLGGQLLAGAVLGSNPIRIYTCSFELLPAARIDVSQLSQLEARFALRIEARNSLRTHAGSTILAKDDGQVDLFYGPAADPPLLEGNIAPEPSLHLVPGLTACSE